MCLRTTLVLGAQLQLPKPVYARFTYKPTEHTVFVVQHEGKGNGAEGMTWKLQLSI